MVSQRQFLREALNAGCTISPMDALEWCGCYRLGARIYELRKSGMDIETNRHPSKRYARYRLKREEAGDDE